MPVHSVKELEAKLRERLDALGVASSIARNVMISNFMLDIDEFLEHLQKSIEAAFREP